MVSFQCSMVEQKTQTKQTNKQTNKLLFFSEEVMVVIHCLISSKNGNWLQRFTLGGKQQQHNTPESIFSEEEKCSILWGVYMSKYSEYHVI